MSAVHSLVNWEKEAEFFSFVIASVQGIDDRRSFDWES